MLEEYYRNGILFLAELAHRTQGDITTTFDSFIKNYQVENIIEMINDEFIRQNFRGPVIELVGSAVMSENSSEADVLKGLGKYFEVSGASIKSGKLLESSFFKQKEGKCTFCGKNGKVFSNMAYVFPFEREIASISPKTARMQFCQKCGFILYCGMAYVYQKNNLLFFFDSYELNNIKKMSMPLRSLELCDPNNYNIIKKIGIQTHYPSETMFVIIFEFVKYLFRKKMISDYAEAIKNVRLIMMAGSGQIYEQKNIEGDVLEKITCFFIELIKKSRQHWEDLDEMKKRKIKESSEDLIFSGFFGNLVVDKGTPEENYRLREGFISKLIEKKVDFVVLNEIIMERLREKKKVVVPYHYYTVITTFMDVMEVNNMEKSMFERINGLGYALGKQMKGTNLENFIWDVFRARGAEQFYQSIVELQAKLKTSIDLRPINEYEKNWREAKAILLNGMLNAIYGGD